MLCWGMIGILLLFNLYPLPLFSTAVSVCPARPSASAAPRHVMWDSDVDFDLAAFHSLVRALKRILVEEANPNSKKTNHLANHSPGDSK